MNSCRCRFSQPYVLGSCARAAEAAEVLQRETICRYSEDHPKIVAAGEAVGREVRAAQTVSTVASAMVASQSNGKSGNSGHLRARIGPQRYAILSTMRESIPLTIEALVGLTGLSEKRIRDQLRVDVPNGVVRQLPEQDGRGPPQFELNVVGNDLLMRFEAYRLAKGKPFPVSASANDEMEGTTAH